MRCFVAAAMLLAAGCVESAVQTCGALICDPGLVCVPERNACHEPDDVAACDGLPQGTPCTGSGGDGVCDRGVCGASPCGDGVLDPSLGEVCDDGNVFDGDGCDASCRVARCLAIPEAAGALARPIADVLGDASCREIFLSPGTYAENLVVDRDVDIIGGGILPAVIDGGAAGPVIEVANQSLTIDGVSVTNGSGICGGGIVATDSDVLLIRSIVEANHAESGAGICQVGGSVILSETELRDNVALALDAIGGGVRLVSGSLIVRNQSRITGNRALGVNRASGGAVHAVQSSVSLSGGCAVDDNGVAPDESSLFATLLGGAVALDGSDLSVSNCTVNNNFAGVAGRQSTAFGGAVYGLGRTYGAIQPIASFKRNSQVSGNVAQGSGLALGGAVFMGAGNLSANQARFEANEVIGATARGGAIMIDTIQPAALSSESSTFAGNRVTSTGQAVGGAIALDAAPNPLVMVIKSTTLSDNDAVSSSETLASQGGALWLSGVDVIGQVVNTTLSGNQADAGGGIMSIMASGLSLQLTNNTVTGNSATALDFSFLGLQARNVSLIDSIVFGNSAPQCAFGAEPIGGDFNVLGDPGSCVITGAVANSSGDPLLGPLRDNGGPTATHAPGSGGSAIDGGNPDGCNVSTDQRGYARGASACTVGAMDPGAAPPPE